MKQINIGQMVDIPEPEAHELWSHSFSGLVVDICNGVVTIEDQDGDCFDIDRTRLETL